MKAKPNIIYINSGKYKNKKIHLPSSSTTRSTKSILKNSFFNTIAYEIIDKNFVEVFGGSGSIGLEALSRGAKKSYFIEKDKLAYKILQKNITSIDSQNSISIFGDSFIELKNILPKLKDKTIFYFDPPFDFRDGMQGIYEKVYSLISILPEDITYLVAIEHSSEVVIPEQIASFKKQKTKKFGNSSISYLKLI